VLTEAELISEKRDDISRHLSLEGTMREALDVNLDLTTQDYKVAAGSENIRNAWSSLKPQLSVSGTGVIIDNDRAKASFGQMKERTVTGSAGFSQVLYSEHAWANVSIQRSLQESRLAEREQVRLDVAVEASIAYLNVLRMKNLERIQKNNLKLVHNNLELAQVRKIIGVAGPVPRFFVGRLRSLRVDR